MRFNFLKNLGLLLLPLATFASNAEVAMVIIEDADKDNYSSAIKTCTDYKVIKIKWTKYLFIYFYLYNYFL